MPKIDLKKFMNVTPDNCEGCKHARKNPESFRGVDCIAELYRACKPDLTGYRIHYTPDVRE